jgi:hypothetical protein
VSGGESEEETNKKEVVANAKKDHKKRKRDLDRDNTKDALVDMIIGYENQETHKISTENILANHIAADGYDKDQMLPEVPPEETGRSAKKGKVPKQKRFVEHEAVIYDVHTLKEQYTVRVLMHP